MFYNTDFIQLQYWHILLKSISDKASNNNVNHTYENEGVNLNELNPVIEATVADAGVHDGSYETVTDRNYETVTETYNEERARPVYTQLSHNGESQAAGLQRNQQNNQHVASEVAYEISI